MATKGKESPSPKEKRITSPISHPRKTNTIPKRKSPSTSKQASPVKRHDSSASKRHIPNYLRPTISSGLDLSANKKNAPGVNKSNIARRKSLDRPLLPSSAQKISISPSSKERSIRSSSLPSRSTIFQKSLPDRLLKLAKEAGKGQTLYGRTASAKKSNTNIKQQGKQSSATKEQITGTSSKFDDSTADIDVIPHLETQQEDKDSSINEVDHEEVSNVGNDNEIGTEVLVMEDDGHVNILPQYEVGSPEVEEVKMVESSMKDQDELIASEIEKQEEILEVGESSQSLSKLKEYHDMDNPQTDATKAKAENEGEEVKEEYAGGQEMGNKEHGNEGLIEDKRFVETENAEEDEAKEIKQGVQNQKKDLHMIEGKKDSSVSNDVIEETATKLLEQRKNKVKALAGAFETVISLKEP